MFLHYKHCEKCGTIVMRTCSLMTPPSSSCLHSFFILLSVARRCTAAGTHGIVTQSVEHRAWKKMQVQVLPMPPKRPLWSWWRYKSKENHTTAFLPAVYDGSLSDGVSYPTIRGGRPHLPSGKSRPMRAPGNGTVPRALLHEVPQRGLLHKLCCRSYQHNAYDCA